MNGMPFRTVPAAHLEVTLSAPPVALPREIVDLARHGIPIPGGYLLSYSDDETQIERMPCRVVSAHMDGEHVIVRLRDAGVIPRPD